MSKRFTRLVWFLAVVHGAVVLAGFIAPYSYDSQHRLAPYCPPMRIHFVDCEGNFHFRPFVYIANGSPTAETSRPEDCAKIATIHFLTRGDGYTFLGLLHSDLHLFGVAEPAHVFLLGTDAFGRDQFSRLLYGGQMSLLVGLVATALAVGAGLVFGALAGIHGGWVDEGIMRLAEVFMAVPWVYLLIAARAFLPLQINPATAFALMIVLIGLAGWGRPARLVRGVVLSAREENFVLAARGFGASNWYLLRRHLIPLTKSVLLTQLAILIPQFILAEVILSFLGLGISEPFPSWGNMLAYAQQYRVLTTFWWMLLPGLAPIPVFMAYHSLGDVLQQRLSLSQSKADR